jgi:hypothetical protein
MNGHGFLAPYTSDTISNDRFRLAWRSPAAIAGSAPGVGQAAVDPDVV